MWQTTSTAHSSMSLEPRILVHVPIAPTKVPRYVFQNVMSQSLPIARPMVLSVNTSGLLAERLSQCVSRLLVQPPQIVRPDRMFVMAETALCPTLPRVLPRSMAALHMLTSQPLLRTTRHVPSPTNLAQLEMASAPTARTKALRLVCLDAMRLMPRLVRRPMRSVSSLEQLLLPVVLIRFVYRKPVTRLRIVQLALTFV
jgi:hypothetical protein